MNPIQYTTDKYLPQVMSSETLDEMVDIMEKWNIELNELQCQK